MKSGELRRLPDALSGVGQLSTVWILPSTQRVVRALANLLQWDQREHRLDGVGSGVKGKQEEEYYMLLDERK